MSPRYRRTLAAVGAAAAALALAACSAGPFAASGAPASAPGSSSSTAGSAPADPTAGLPKGPQLAAMLLTARQVPSPLRADAPGTRDSGSMYAEPSTGPAPAHAACQDLDSTAWVDIVGMTGDSFAQSDFTDSYSNLFAQEIDAFEGTAAHTVMSRIQQAFTKCASFKDKHEGNGYTAKLTWKHLAGVGDEALEATTTAGGFSGGNTLIAVRVGKLVVTTIYVDQKSTGAADLGLTRTLVQRAANAAW